ncbi:hypothetical protein IAQ61_002274 [Plenodomus lingam]|uniref:uncharacterized protein n=1 Tax=Leptosphaeria maculans TaxID=5022 RepID=UPI003331B514|nr:hypothetical protein IAQ61_002274 [Plenodomus lingam]
MTISRGLWGILGHKGSRSVLSNGALSKVVAVLIPSIGCMRTILCGLKCSLVLACCLVFNTFAKWKVKLKLGQTRRQSIAK